MLNDKLITKIDTDGKYWFRAFILSQIVWLGLLFVLKLCQETSKKQP